MIPTEKQLLLIKKYIEYFGLEKVDSYLHHFFPNADIHNLTRKEAQKIITGLSSKMPRPIIKNVYKRDYFGRI